MLVLLLVIVIVIEDMLRAMNRIGLDGKTPSVLIRERYQLWEYLPRGANGVPFEWVIAAFFRFRRMAS